jgi:hypothetical protein
MLPFGGQGSNQAIEDGGALGFLFNGIENAEDIPKRLVLLEKARKDRTSRVQILSKVRAGKEKEVEEELRRYADPPGSGKSDLDYSTVQSYCMCFLVIDQVRNTAVPTTMQERTAHDYRQVPPK